MKISQFELTPLYAIVKLNLHHISTVASQAYWCPDITKFQFSREVKWPSTVCVIACPCGSSEKLHFNFGKVLLSLINQVKETSVNYSPLFVMHQNDFEWMLYCSCFSTIDLLIDTNTRYLVFCAILFLKLYPLLTVVFEATTKKIFNNRLSYRQWFVDHTGTQD